MAKQNLKMVVLTEPGERIMMPTFGVGVKRKLFENEQQFYSIRQKIIEQVSKYLPYISIIDIAIFKDENQNTQFYDNSINLSIKFFVKNFGLSETLDIKIRN
jgi:phage baseplate assembly protein W